MKDGDFVVRTTIYFKNICCICNNVFSGLYGYVTFFNLIKKYIYMSLHLVYKYEYPQKKKLYINGSNGTKSNIYIPCQLDVGVFL